MKRDMHIIRSIVLAVRSSEGPISKVEGVDSDLFAIHAQWLEEAGLIHAAVTGDKRAATSAVIFRLSWVGHDFADSIVDDSVWNKAKENVLKPAASWSFGILLEYLKFEIKRRVPGLDQILNRLEQHVGWAECNEAHQRPNLTNSHDRLPPLVYPWCFVVFHRQPCPTS